VGSGTEGFGWWGDAGEGDESAESDLPVFVLENNQVVLKLNHFDSQQMSTPFDHYYWRKDLNHRALKLIQVKLVHQT